jgi:hypothetical protein
VGAFHVIQNYEVVFGVHLDVQDDPCEVNHCSIYAECTPDVNSDRGYTCSCRIGYDGDGVTCYGKQFGQLSST